MGDPSHSPNWEAIHAFFLAVSILMSLILMNLFIGVLSQNYELYENMSEELFTRERAKIMHEYHEVLMLVRFLATPLDWIVPSCCQRKHEYVEPRRLALYKVEQPDLAEERSIR